MPEALITGASGFVGGYLLRALLESGWRVTTLDARAHRPLDGVRSIVADLRTLPAIRGRFDVVFHLAALSHVPTCEADPAAAFDVNVLGTLRLLRATSGRFVFVGSGDIYGPGRVDESARPRPANAYAASKTVADALAAARDVLVLRPFNHTGPGQAEQFVAPRFAAQIARIEAGLQPPEIRVGNLWPVRDFLDVRDVVRAYLLALGKAPPGVYNIASGQGVSIGDLLRMLQGLSRAPFEIVPDPKLLRAGEPRERLGDATKFRLATGWEPRIPLRRTLADLLEYERARLGTLKSWNGSSSRPSAPSWSRASSRS